MLPLPISHGRRGLSLAARYLGAALVEVGVQGVVQHLGDGEGGDDAALHVAHFHARGFQRGAGVHVLLHHVARARLGFVQRVLDMLE